MKEFKFFERETGTIDLVDIDTRVTASALFAGLSGLPTPPSLSDYRGNYAAFNEAMRRYLRAIHMSDELSNHQRNALSNLVNNPPTTEQNMMAHIERIERITRRINDGGEIFARSADNSIVLKPKWWMRVKMKFQALKIWMKALDLYILTLITLCILVGIPMFYMLIYTIIQK
jgi:hypothetical protein